MSGPDASVTPSAGREAYSTSELLSFGFVNIDKPAGYTSHDAVEALRRILRLRRVGHSGTLDPAVTGSLPMGLDLATRLLGYFLAGGKTYQCRMYLHEDRDAELVRETLARFVGEIQQIPPRRSRVVRKLRTRRVYWLEDIEQEGRDVSFTVDCEAGTYIRTLCVDVGEALGCGAHMIGLRRIRTGPFHVDSLLTLDRFADLAKAWRKEGDETLREFLYPPQIAVAHLPSMRLSEEEVAAIRVGKVVAAADQSTAPGAVVALYTPAGQLLALSEARDKFPGTITLHPSKVFKSHPEK